MDVKSQSQLHAGLHFEYSRMKLAPRHDNLTLLKNVECSIGLIGWIRLLCYTSIHPGLSLCVNKQAPIAMKHKIPVESIELSPSSDALP